MKKEWYEEKWKLKGFLHILGFHAWRSDNLSIGNLGTGNPLYRFTGCWFCKAEKKGTNVYLDE